MLPLPSAGLRFQVAGEVCAAGAWQGFSRTPRTPRSSPRSPTLRAWCGDAGGGVEQGALLYAHESGDRESSTICRLKVAEHEAGVVAKHGQLLLYCFELSPRQVTDQGDIPTMRRPLEQGP